jgi:hypothetical protein
MLSGASLLRNIAQFHQNGASTQSIGMGEAQAADQSRTGVMIIEDQCPDG